MVIDPNFKKVKICEEIRDERIEIERSIDFNGKFIIIKSLFVNERLEDSVRFKNPILKEMYISPDFLNFEVYEK